MVLSLSEVEGRIIVMLINKIRRWCPVPQAMLVASLGRRHNVARQKNYTGSNKQAFEMIRMVLSQDGRSKNGVASWIADGEKYALVGLGAKFSSIPLRKLAANLWVFANRPFVVPKHWHDWLGSIRAEEIQSFNLFLLSKIASRTPDILDDENVLLKQRAWEFYVGLLLTSRFAPSHKPVLITGSRRAGEIDIRQQQDIDLPVPCIFQPYPEIAAGEIELAAQLLGQLAALA